MLVISSRGSGRFARGRSGSSSGFFSAGVRRGARGAAGATGAAGGVRGGPPSVPVPGVRPASSPVLWARPLLVALLSALEAL